MYQFIIPNKKLNIYLTFALGILILNIIGFSINDSLSGKQSSWIFAIIIALLVIFNLFVLPFQKRIQYIGTLILISGIFWLSKEQAKLFLIDIILWALYTVARRRLLVHIEKSGISYPAFPKKGIPWSAVSNVILKDDILTIDLKNNKIYQHLIEYADKEVNEAEFNDFCRVQLESSR